MTPLSTAEIEKLQSLLRQRQRVLLDDLRRDSVALRDATAHMREPGADGGEQSGSDHSAALSAGEMTRDADELQAVESALERIARGDYGACAECDEAIPAKRLRASPIAVRCIACQTRYERDHPSSAPHSL